MKRHALYGLAMAALAWAAPVLAQPVNLPANTVWGRLGIGTGPGQAIPFLTLQSALGITVGTEIVSSGSSTATSYGLLFNKNGIVGDTNKDTSLSNGITGPPITISGNSAPLPNIASIVGGGGITPFFQIATTDEGETLFALQSFGTNSNATIAGVKARGTAAAPLPLLNGDIIFTLSANGWAAAGVNGGAAGTGAIYFVATENWSSTATGTGIEFITQVNGTAYPSSNAVYGMLNGDGGWTFGLQPATPLQSFGPGAVSMTKGVFINPNTAVMNSGVTGNTIHSSQVNGTENSILLDAFAADAAIIFRRGNTSQAAPSALAANDLIGGIFAHGMGSTVFSTARAAFSFFANQTWTDANQGTYADIQTTTNNSTTRATRVRVENDGGVTVPNTVTGGSCGAGCINAIGLRVANSAVIAGSITLSGDVTGTGTNAITTALTNIPSGVTMPGFIDATPIAAPANPASPKARLYVDNVQGNLVAKLNSGALSTTVIPDTGAANNFLTAISPGGVISKAQPSFANLSGAATRAQGASDMVLLNTLTASSSATLSDTTSITATYDLYMIEIENVVPVTNATTFKMQVSQDTGGTWKSTTYLDSSTNTDGIYIGAAIDNTAGKGVSSVFYFMGPNRTDNVKYAAGRASNVAAGAVSGNSVDGWYDGNLSAINAIRFLATAGNLSTGKIRIYGIKTS